MIMNKNIEPVFSEYKFVSLLILILAKQGISIIEKDQLQEELYKYYKKEEYKILFEDIAAKTGIDFAYLDLDNSLLAAMTFGLITNVESTFRKTKSIITITKIETKETLKYYEQKHITAMENLVREMINDKDQLQEDQTNSKEKGYQRQRV